MAEFPRVGFFSTPCPLMPHTPFRILLSQPGAAPTKMVSSLHPGR